LSRIWADGHREAQGAEKGRCAALVAGASGFVEGAAGAAGARTGLPICGQDTDHTDRQITRRRGDFLGEGPSGPTGRAISGNSSWGLPMRGIAASSVSDSRVPGDFMVPARNVCKQVPPEVGGVPPGMTGTRVRSVPANPATTGPDLIRSGRPNRVRRARHPKVDGAEPSAATSGRDGGAAKKIETKTTPPNSGQGGEGPNLEA